MYRPLRQWNNLSKKIDLKASRAKKRGKKQKRWRKWLESYKAISNVSADAASTGG